MTCKRGRVRYLSGMILVLTALFFAEPLKISAQDAGATTPDDTSSSVFASFGSDTNVSAQTAPPDASASISGMVQDMTGAAVAGAEVSLTAVNGSLRSTVQSGANGEFTFSVSPGSYRVLVNAKDFEPFRSAEIVVTEQRAYEIPGIFLRVAPAKTQLTVRPTEVIAAQQIKAQEKQRIIGIVPNFYTSYIYYAAPLTTKQKFSLVSHDVFDPLQFVGAGIIAGAEQATNRFPGYGQGFEGYGKRYAAAFGDTVTRDYLSYAVFPSLFHQDPRYFYQGSGSTGSRLLHALSFAVALRGDNGRNMPNYSFILGSLGSAALSNLYYPPGDRGARLVFTNFGIGVAGRAGVAVLREFVSKRFTTNVPGNGKP